MKTLKIKVVLVLLFSLTACRKTENTAEIKSTTQTTKNTIKNDKKVIEALIKDMYHWEEKRPYMHDFEPIMKDTLVIGFDMENHKQYLEDLRKSGFFAQEFINNMDRIVKKQSDLFSSGEAEWTGQDLPPFGFNADQWCNCQDYATDDDPYSKITITFGKVDDEKAELSWDWSDFNYNIPYRIRTVKESGKWKIAWMQGWDYEANVSL